MYGPIGSHGMSTAVDIIAPILGIAAIAAAIVLFIKFASKKADKTKPLTKFFSFDHLFIESITKFLYVFSTTSIAAFCLIYPFMSAPFEKQAVDNLENHECEDGHDKTFGEGPRCSGA